MTDTTTDYTPLLNRGVQLRIQAKAMKEESDAMKDEATQLFEVALTISGKKKLIHKQGVVKRKPTKSSTLDKGKLASVLVSKGVLATVVAKAITEATETKEGETIEFRETKRKE